MKLQAQAVLGRTDADAPLAVARVLVADEATSAGERIAEDGSGVAHGTDRAADTDGGG